MTKTNRVGELLASAEQYLQSITSARLDAELLLSHSMGTNRANLYAHPELSVPEDVAANFQLLLNKRINDYPVAYLTGHREFWSLDLKVDRNTLIPRPETECVVETALECISTDQQRDILDLGCGSGAIALAIAMERSDVHVLAVDVSQEALAVAMENAEKHNIGNIRFLQSDWFSELRGNKFDLIISNPPYVESDDTGFITGEIRHEPRLALDGGLHGLQAITQLIPTATHFLKPDGRFILEHGHRQAESIRALFADNQYEDIKSRQDYANLDRLSYARWP